MSFIKTFDNGLKLVVKKIDGLLSVTTGIIVGTGSINETAQTNGISHYLEHVMFKGTKKRSSFEISDSIDRIGGQINAFTAKEITCYYTKSTTEHFEEALEILSDLFINSIFDEKELEKEKGVVLEEISMCEDTPEDLCSDLMAESYFGKDGLGQKILGTALTVKSFTRSDVLDYIEKYYVPSNVVVSIAGNIDEKQAEELVEKYLANAFKTKDKPLPKRVEQKTFTDNLIKVKDIEQAHIGLTMPAVKYGHKDGNALSIINYVFGGGMSSRLFQKIREDLGLAYTVSSYTSQYKDLGIMEIYAGVNPEKRDLAFDAIIEEVKLLKTNGITTAEFNRGKEQMKSAFIYSQESTASQMLLYGKNLLFSNEIFDFDRRIAQINAVTEDDVKMVIDEYFDLNKGAVACVGRSDKKLIF